MAISINDYCYGTQEFDETLQTIAQENDFTPIQNMMEWSKNYYDTNVNIFPATILHFIKMVVDEESSDEAVLAGWILAFNAVLTSKEKLSEHGMPREAQKKLIIDLFVKVQECSRFTYYHANNYFHQHPVFARNFSQEP